MRKRFYPALLCGLIALTGLLAGCENFSFFGPTKPANRAPVISRFDIIPSTLYFGTGATNSSAVIVAAASDQEGSNITFTYSFSDNTYTNGITLSGTDSELGKLVEFDTAGIVSEDETTSVQLSVTDGEDTNTVTRSITLIAAYSTNNTLSPFILNFELDTSALSFGEERDIDVWVSETNATNADDASFAPTYAYRYYVDGVGSIAANGSNATITAGSTDGTLTVYFTVEDGDGRFTQTNLALTVSE